MGSQKLDVLVNGGKATAAPPLGPALGPLGVNIGQVIADINKKTEAFAGMQVPVTLEVDDKTKEYTISVGTPPASALIKKEAGIDKASGNAKADKVADLKIQQVVKISKMKEDDLLGKDEIARAKEIIGSCNGMGVLVEGKPGKEVCALIDKGEYVDIIKSGKTELTAEELKALEEEKKKLKAEMEARRAEFEAKATEIASQFANKSRNEVKKKMIEAGIPEAIYESKLPSDKASK